MLLESHSVNQAPVSISENKLNQTPAQERHREYVHLVKQL